MNLLSVMCLPKMNIIHNGVAQRQMFQSISTCNIYFFSEEESYKSLRKETAHTVRHSVVEAERHACSFLTILFSRTLRVDHEILPHPPRQQRAELYFNELNSRQVTT